jgi:hypothetical protein
VAAGTDGYHLWLVLSLVLQLSHVARAAEVEEGEWTANGEGKEERDKSFTMKLSGSIGPSSTRCEIVEVVEHFDEEAFIAVKGKTRIVRH